MRNQKEKKFWREKVTAEIGVVHVQALAQEMGTTMTVAEVAEFLNQSGVAQKLWLQMMQAGEAYIKSNLKAVAVPLPHAMRISGEPRMVQ